MLMSSFIKVHNKSSLAKETIFSQESFFLHYKDFIEDFFSKDLSDYKSKLLQRFKFVLKNLKHFIYENRENIDNIEIVKLPEFSLGLVIETKESKTEKLIVAVHRKLNEVYNIIAFTPQLESVLIPNSKKFVKSVEFFYKNIFLSKDKSLFRMFSKYSMGTEEKNCFIEIHKEIANQKELFLKKFEMILLSKGFRKINDELYKNSHYYYNPNLNIFLNILKVDFNLNYDFSEEYGAVRLNIKYSFDGINFFKENDIDYLKLFSFLLMQYLNLELK